MTERNIPNTQIIIPATSPQPADEFPLQFGNYEIISELGRGGMGAVFLAEHKHLGKRRALKLIRPDLAKYSDSIARFQREMLAAGRLEHPNIIQAVDAGQHEGVHYLAMEFANGPDIRRVVKQQTTLRPNDAAEIVRQACLGLEEIRKQGLVHRDIKTSNMIVTREGVVKLLDLGLARSLAKITNDDLSLTVGGAILGTADYMAPEQADDSTDVDIRADIYSLGCAFFEMLFGRTPFHSPEFDSWQKKVLAHAREPIVIPVERRNDVPAEMCEVMLRMLAKSRDQRFATPGEVAQAVTKFVQHADLASLASSTPMPQPPAGQTLPSSGNWNSWTPSILSQNTTAVAPAIGANDEQKPVANRRVWLRVGFATAVLAIVGLAAAGVSEVAGWRRGPVASSGDDDGLGSPPKIVPLIPNERDAPDEVSTVSPSVRSFDQVDFEVRYPLFDQSPTEIRWLNTSALSNWNYNEKNRLVTLTSADEGLLAVGEIQGESYQIEVAMHQTEWTSGAGIFWGYAPGDSQGSGTASDAKTGRHCLYQFVRFLDREAGESNFRLQRGCVYLTSQENGSVITSNEVFESLPIPFPVRGEMTLKLEIKNRELYSVRLEDKELFDPHKEHGSNPFFKPEDYNGSFGVFCQGATATFRNGSMKRLLNR